MRRIVVASVAPALLTASTTSDASDKEPPLTAERISSSVKIDVALDADSIFELASPSQLRQ